MYIILSSSNLFLEILDGNYYISKIVETRDEDLVLNLQNYVKIWNAETWLTLSGVSITGVSTGYSLASVSGTNLTITSEKLQSISTSTVTFSITATYTQGEVSISRDINVVLYLPTVSE